MTWDFSPPQSSSCNDSDVILDSQHLKNKNIALLVTGSIAAFKTPILIRALRRQGAKVTAYLSSDALKYTTKEAVQWSSQQHIITELSSNTEHLSEKTPFDAYLIAPASYNTINKIANGIADNAITTTIASALGKLQQKKTSVLIAPAMHGSMHNPILTQSMRQLSLLGVQFIQPKDQLGKHLLADETIIINEVCRSVSQSTLKGQSILVTAGTTPVYIDDVRYMTNRFTGELGSLVAESLFLRGADVLLIKGQGGYISRPGLPVKNIFHYDEYRQQVKDSMQQTHFDYGIFSAAVADYQPVKKVVGKIPSGGELSSIKLKSTAKVIDEVLQNSPSTQLISFKYYEKIDHAEMISNCQQRIELGHWAVIANCGEEIRKTGDHVAHLIHHNTEIKKIISKSLIAEGIVKM
ncbi:MAG: bifunctional phosphopantothenoylcysteine decarboxylase/phosphopantothenate--cysteine ligase CoaBC, partial [Methylococcales bacterium]|nr:bifunctional phosphopantothenoylcysteine decarboxylase/phosphopantothenate--cysteine ligase CoaBC [Methylococcales bacterium]